LVGIVTSANARLVSNEASLPPEPVIELNTEGVAIFQLYPSFADIPEGVIDVRVVFAGFFKVNDRSAVPSLSAMYSVAHDTPTCTVVDDVTNVHGNVPACGVMVGVKIEPVPGVKSSHAKYCRPGSFQILCRVRDGTPPNRANGPRFVVASDPERIEFSTASTAFVAFTYNEYTTDAESSGVEGPTNVV
jgi:hypothetical protein